MALTKKYKDWSIYNCIRIVFAIFGRDINIILSLQSFPYQQVESIAIYVHVCSMFIFRILELYVS